MSDFGRRFDPGELEHDGRQPSDADAAGLLATARDLEAYARADHVSPSIDFEDRVMAAIATEPPPRPALMAGGLTGLLGTLRDAWRIVWTSGPPLAVRAQAFALVLVAAVALGSVGTLATVGAIRLLAPDGPPAPTLEPVPTPAPSTPAPSLAPSPTPSPSVPPSPSPSPTASPTASPSPTDDETAEPTETPEGTDDSSGPGSGGSGDDSPGRGSDDDSSGSGSGSGD